MLNIMENKQKMILSIDVIESFLIPSPQTI